MGTYGQPDGDVGVSWGTSATSVLLITERSDHDWVGYGSWVYISKCPSLRRIRRHRGWLNWVFRRFGVRVYIPVREASSGFMSKISTPFIFPRISRRSRPVACSISVGMDPTEAPGGMRSASLLISVLWSALLLCGVN